MRAAWQWYRSRWDRFTLGNKWSAALWWSGHFTLGVSLGSYLLGGDVTARDVAVRFVVSTLIGLWMWHRFSRRAISGRERYVSSRRASPESINAEQGSSDTTEADSPRAREDRVKR